MTAAAAPFDGALPHAAAIVSAARSERRRRRGTAGAAGALDEQLVLAADQFRSRPQAPTAVAGYPWFGEWSRDLMTSYEGLYLATNRHDEGREALRTSAATVSEGMLANTADTGSLEYNTVDGTLWFVHAARPPRRRHRRRRARPRARPCAGRDRQHHVDGTRYGIGVDPADGLLRQGADGWALTWMDARIDGVPVTQRMGKPVEVNALWLRARRRWRLAPTDLARATLRTRHGPRSSRFARADGGGLLDSSTGPAATTGRCDPISCSPSRCPAARSRVPTERPTPTSPPDRCRGLPALLTPLGLSSLSPDDPAYRPLHRGRANTN